MAKTEGKVSDEELDEFIRFVSMLPGNVKASAKLAFRIATELQERRAANSDGGVEPWKGREETYATLASKWPDWLHDEVDRALDAAEKFEWSTEQVLAYAILMRHPPAKAFDGIAVTDEMVERAAIEAYMEWFNGLAGGERVWAHVDEMFKHRWRKASLGAITAALAVR